VQQPLGASHQAAQRNRCLFAIGHFLRVNHLPSNCFTDGEPTGRYQTFGLPLCLAPPDLQQFQWLFFSREPPRVLGIRRDLDSYTNKKSNS